MQRPGAAPSVPYHRVLPWPAGSLTEVVLLGPTVVGTVIVAARGGPMRTPARPRC